MLIRRTLSYYRLQRSISRVVDSIAGYMGRSGFYAKKLWNTSTHRGVCGTQSPNKIRPRVMYMRNLSIMQFHKAELTV